MPHTFHQLYYHFAWATQGRLNLIDRRWRPELLEIIRDEARLRGGLAIRHNAMPDHMRLHKRVGPTVPRPKCETDEDDWP